MEIITKRNIIIDCYRILLSFLVVCCHFWSGHDDLAIPRYLYLMRDFAVPSFMVISFYFTSDGLLNDEKKYFLQRMIRLIYPATIWAFAYFFIYNISNEMFHTEFGQSGGWLDIVWQIIVGSRLNSAMWYVSDLIIISCIYHAVGFAPERIQNIIIIIISIICVLLQFTGINKMIWDNSLPELKSPIGRIAEMFPFSLMGYFFSKLNEKTKKNVPIAIVLFVFSVVTVYAYGINHTVRGFGYAGIFPLVITFLVFGSVFLLPEPELHNSKISSAISKIARLTFGIYCIHMLVGNIMLAICQSLSIKSLNLMFCAIVFFTSLTISWIISISKNRYLLRLVI